MSAGVFVRSYSIAEAADRAQADPVNPVNRDHQQAQLQGTGKASFRGLPHDMAFGALRAFWANGWPEGAARIRTAMGEVAVPAVVSIRRRGRWADAGDELNRERVYAGDLERAWRTTSRAQVSAPRVVRVIIDIAANCGTGADSLFWRGAAGASLAEALTAAGYSVEIVAASAAQAVSSKGESVFTATTVKGAESPLNLTALAAATASASFFRGCVFATMNATVTGAACSSLGYTIPLTEAREALATLGIAQTPETRSFIVNGDVLDAESARLWVGDVVDALQKETAFA